MLIAVGDDVLLVVKADKSGAEENLSVRGALGCFLALAHAAIPPSWSARTANAAASSLKAFGRLG